MSQTTYMLDKRQVDNVKIEFELGEGAYVLSATFVDDGTDLDDQQCEDVTDTYQAELYQQGYEDAMCAAFDRVRGDS